MFYSRRRKTSNVTRPKGASHQRYSHRWGTAGRQRRRPGENTVWNGALFSFFFFSSAAEYATVFSPSPFWRSSARGGSDILGGGAAGVVRTRTGGSPSSPFPVFSRAKGEKIPWREPRRSRSTLVTTPLFSSAAVRLIHIVSAFASPEKIIFGEGGKGGGRSGGVFWFFFFFLAGSTAGFVRQRLELLFHPSWLA